MLNVKVGLVGKMDMLKTKNLAKNREKVIAAAPQGGLAKTEPANVLASDMHPEFQKVYIDRIDEQSHDAKTFVLKSCNGEALAPFRPGQFITVSVKIGNTLTTRSYSICSTPLLSRYGEYNITVKKTEDGFVSPWIHDNWQVGDEITISGPQGYLFYEPGRDTQHVIGVAGGSGITPFFSMAKSIRDGAEMFRLTLIIGARTEDDIMFREKLEEITKATSRVKLVYVLSDEEKEGYEHGFITADILRKYAGDGEFTLFMAGPQAMYDFVGAEAAKLGLRRKFIRPETYGTIHNPWEFPGYPQECHGKVFNLRVRRFNEECTIPCSADESVLVAIERAGIPAPSRCRSGECGWCRSKLVSGDVFIPEKTDGRRAADKDFGYIHPCSTFPLSDLQIIIPGNYIEYN